MPENLKELSSEFLETKQNNKSKAFQKKKINKYTWSFKKGRLAIAGNKNLPPKHLMKTAGAFDVFISTT